MNKKVIEIKTIEKIEECSIEEVVNDFLDCYDVEDLEEIKEDFEYEIANYLKEEEIEYSEEEKESFIKLVKEKIDEKINSIKESEIKQLSNRKSIYEWVSGLLDYMRSNAEIDPGDVGFLLSVDEIIDLIAQNGHKE